MDWKRFLTIHLPTALTVSAMLAEGAAWALDGITPRRHDLDRLVAALDGPTVAADIVLAGDSVTQDVLKSFRIGDAPLANLTTNQASGLIGTSFLLRRYLDGNPPPRHVVIAATPEFFAYDPSGIAARTYVISVFRRPDEQRVLQNLGIAAASGWRPAALTLEERIGEKLTGLFGGHPTMPGGEAVTTATGGEPGPILPGVASQIRHRAAHDLTLTPSVRNALESICTQSAKTGFTLHLVRAPVPASVLEERSERDAAQREALAGATKGCAEVRFADMNSPQSYPDHAFRDADHLRRPGWTSVYAHGLAAYVSNLHTNSADGS